MNYVILADGYTVDDRRHDAPDPHHERDGRAFNDPRWAEPYIRYKNFVNICLFKTVSQNDGIGQTELRRDSSAATGDDTSRLATCNTQVAQQQLTANTPPGMTVAWHSIVLNNNRWWNTGLGLDALVGRQPRRPRRAAMHEGGHGFHQLADEYGTCTGRQLRHQHDGQRDRRDRLRGGQLGRGIR